MSCSLGSEESFALVHPCIFCGVGLGPHQFQSPDHGAIVTVYPGCVCDVCYDARYPTPETSAKARRDAQMIFPRQFYDEFVREHPVQALLFLCCGCVFLGFAAAIVLFGP